MVPIILLILAVVVLIGGLAVVAVNRSRGGPAETRAPRAPHAPRPHIPTPIIDELPIIDAEEEAEVVGHEAQALLERPRFRDRLTKARSTLAGAFSSLRATGVTDENWDRLEAALYAADIGPRLTSELLDSVKEKVTAEKITDPEEVLALLKADIRAHFGDVDRGLALEPEPGAPDVWLFVGVNGVGKTTTIGKVASWLIGEGHTVVLAAGDTFRAAAAEQLTAWAERSGAEVVRGNEGGDPSAVIFDAVQRAAARNADLVLADTAGRLHTKVNLMEELRKVRRVAEKEKGRVTEVLLVLDAVTGQNGLVQAREFLDAVEVTGVVLTKLDGSAKGGIVLAIESELGIPVKLVGLGEGIGDLVAFDPDEFVDALFA
jgi:fused signal recognition particle receptor